MHLQNWHLRWLGISEHGGIFAEGRNFYLLFSTLRHLQANKTHLTTPDAAWSDFISRASLRRELFLSSPSKIDLNYFIFYRIYKL